MQREASNINRQIQKVVPMNRTLLTLALSAFASAASAQFSGVDLGATAPTPGPADVSQLLTTGDTVQLQDGSINYFYDNTGSPYVGTSFTTGANPGGYKLTSLAFKFGGGQPVGYAGGNDTTLDPGWILTFYQLTGTGHTVATPIYTNVTDTLAGTGNTGADWIQITNGFTNVTLQPNSVYAWTIYQPNGYDDLAYATGTPYTGGTICRIPPGGGAVTYASDPDSATFDVGLSQINLVLGGSDLGQTAPTAGPNDIAQLLTTGDTVALPDGNLNDFYDNTTPNQNGGGGYVGTSFTTGANPGGYVANTLAFKFGGGQPVGYAGGNDTSPAGGWIISFYQLSGTGDLAAAPIYTNNVGTITGTGNTGADWIEVTGLFVPMLPNTEYAWTIYQPNGYDDLAYATGMPYASGALCRIEPGGGTVTYYPADDESATFAIGVSLQGYPGVGLATASPNPCYALSPIVISETASGPGTLTYQWQTNSDLSGNLAGTWANVSGATNVDLDFTPQDIVGESYYTLDFELIVANSAGSITSTPVALSVVQSQAPMSSTGVTPTDVITYAGGDVSYSDTSFVGTTPIFYQWQVNTGSGYVNISSGENPSATNSTLNLTNVQAGAVGSYQLLAFNSQGTNNDSVEGVGTLSLLTPPPLPVSTTPQNVPYLQLSNSPYAFWRLQETNNPATSPYPVVAYDYSGNGFFATYGAGVTTSNAGPQPPLFPGFPATELAAGTTPDAYLTAPALNLGFTTNVTFTAWIDPSQGEASATGLFFSRNGGDASGFGFNGNPNGAGMACLGFTWDENSSSTWGWNSGLYPIAGLWSFVAYVITPTNETTYLAYVNTGVTPYTTNFLQSTIVLNNEAESFSVPSFIGADTQQTSGRTFVGSIAEVALYTNSLSQDSVQTLFLTGIGGTSLKPSPPPSLPSAALFTGESFQLNGTAGGSPPLTYQWQSSSDGLNWSDVPTNVNYSGGTSPILQIINATTNQALEYEVVVSNPGATVTSGVSTISVTPVPTGVWTANFQLTNATDEYGFIGLGSYTGHGVLGNGTFWNPISDTLNAFQSGTFYSTSDFLDDGVTHTGIGVSVSSADGFTSSTAPTPSGSIQTLLGQYVQFFGTITMSGVPDGTYNLALYTIDGSFANDGENINVNAANGTVSATCINKQDNYFAPDDNTALFTDIQATNGILTVTMTTAVNNPDFCGLQLQLVSYDESVSDMSVMYAVTNVVSESNVTNSAMTLTWSEGSLQIAPNVAGPWVTIPGQSPVTVITTNTQQYFRLMFPPE
jgi:hypothetical protein